MSNLYLSPSRIARYYFFECDRYLRYMAVPRERRRDERIPKVAYDYSPVTRAVLEGGSVWEQEVLTRHLDGTVVEPPETDPPLPYHQRTVPYHDTVTALASLQPGDAIYQPTLQVPDSFYRRFGLDPDQVEFRDCYPDLVLCVDGDNGPELAVVDVKASTWMKLSHRIQVGVYTLILAEVLRSEGIDTPVSRRGGVWLYGQDRPEWFDLAYVAPPVETFLTDDLPRILRTDPAAAFWHLGYRCEWCEYFPSCREEAEATGDVSLVPYLSHFAKRHLADLAGVRTVGDLARVLDSDTAEEVVAGCASLEDRIPQLRRAVAALQSGKALPTGATSVAMPVGEQIRVAVTVQSEPLTGEMYAYAVQRVFGTALYGSGSELRVGVAASKNELADLRRRLVTDLMEILEPVDRHNRNTDVWRDQKSVQTYVYDTYERGLLTTVLLQASLDPEVADDALTLLFHFQRPGIVEADDHPDTEVFFAVVALTEVIRSTFALPVPVSYQLAPVSEALAPSDYPWVYRESDLFSFQLSNRMKSNAIFEVWHRGRLDLVDDIETELKHRVRAANSIVNGIRERLDGTGALFAWPPKFAFPAGSRFRHPVLSRLAFIARYEAVVAYLEVRTRRGALLEERLADDTTFRLTYLGDDRYRLDPDQTEADLEVSDWKNWILTGDHEAGRRARLAYDDFRYRRAMYAPGHLDLALAAVVARESTDVIRLDLTYRDSFTPPEPGDVVYLEPRFTDWTTERLLDELAALDADDDPWFVELLADPVRARHDLTDRTLRSQALELASRHGMTASQQEAFAAALDHDLQLVWGPPGTGKTHFLALAVLCLAETHLREGRPFRVLVTAMTNTAIDNLLAKLTELQRDTGLAAGVEVGKLRGDGTGGIRSFDPREAGDAADTYSWLVLGATVWQARKTPPDRLRYDLVVIDEGSQLRVGDAAIAFRRVAPSGRVVVAGDDRQLPPIVQAEFPVPEGELPLHRSILEALRAGDPDGLLTCTLTENFRMNDRLCDYPRRSIYPAAYRPATDEVARRRLRVGPAAEELVGLLVDPDWPVTLCVLEEVRATTRNPVEAALAARVVAEMRDLLPVADDEQFAAESVFVVSPHHAQIRLLRRALDQLRDWDPRPLVDTVDKMQGQERDAVVVSYGVSDVETALMEKQFIFSLNRLNVSITRAKAKTILFLPRPLLEPPIQVLDDDEVAEGVAYMQGLMHWCIDQTDPITTTADGIPMTVYRG